MSLTRFHRGSREAVAHLRAVTGASVVWDFVTDDEPATLHAPTNERWERATTPSKALAEAVAKLDVYGRRRDDDV